MQGFQKTGLGERVATIFVKTFGKSTLGLSYGLNAAEALIAPAMPSTTARAGGIFMPIINSLALASDSKPGEPLSPRSFSTGFGWIHQIRSSMSSISVPEIERIVVMCWV